MEGVLTQERAPVWLRESTEDVHVREVPTSEEGKMSNRQQTSEIKRNLKISMYGSCFSRIVNKIMRKFGSWSRSVHQIKYMCLLTFQLPMTQSAQSTNNNSPWLWGHLNDANTPLPQFLQSHFSSRYLGASCSELTLISQHYFTVQSFSNPLSLELLGWCLFCQNCCLRPPAKLNFVPFLNLSSTLPNIVKLILSPWWKKNNTTKIIHLPPNSQWNKAHPTISHLLGTSILMMEVSRSSPCWSVQDTSSQRWSCDRQ